MNFNYRFHILTQLAMTDHLTPQCRDKFGGKIADDIFKDLFLDSKSIEVLPRMA